MIKCRNKAQAHTHSKGLFWAYIGVGVPFPEGILHQRIHSCQFIRNRQSEIEFKEIF